MNEITPFKLPIYITRPLLPPIKQVRQKVQEIWESGWLTNMGDQHKRLEIELKEYLKVKYLTLFCNGTIALEIACKALNLKGDVITTPFTFPATITSLLQNNLNPVFCDIKFDDFNINPNLIEDLITPKTCAIMPVHVFGNPCEIEKISKIKLDHNLKLIFDAAHCFGIKYKNIGIGNYGDINMFSFHATKIFHTLEGGALTYNNPDLVDKLALLKNFGIKNEEEVILPGTNGKMNELQAAIGLLTLKLVDKEIQKRKKLTLLYKEKLNDIDGIRYLEENKDVNYNYQYFPILIDESKFKLSRNQVYDKLKKYNIFSRKYFYPLSTSYQFLKSKYSNNLINAETIAKRVLCLPLYGELTEDDIIKICQIIKILK